MKLSKTTLVTLILITSIFTLTACQNNTSYINDQTGKAISVTTSDDSYSFKLPAAQSEKTSSVAPESNPDSLAEDSEEMIDSSIPPITIVEPEVQENLPKESLDSKGPKTGEP